MSVHIIWLSLCLIFVSVAVCSARNAATPPAGHRIASNHDSWVGVYDAVGKCAYRAASPRRMPAGMDEDDLVGWKGFLLSDQAGEVKPNSVA
jgi:hypothetical protein